MTAARSRRQPIVCVSYSAHERPSRRVESPDLSGDDALSEALAALASPQRLQLLRQLRAPKVLRDVSLSAEGEGGGRPLARQTVSTHLEKLVAAGLVTSRETDRGYGATTEYVLNHQAIFFLSEELRTLARLRPLAEPESVTLQGASQRPGALAGPCLLLVKGADEGATFPLPAKSGTPRAWVLGRRRGVEVCLDFDPYLSSENSVVRWDGAAFHVEDLPQSRNGTTLNFSPLLRGERRRLAHGDIVGVGRSLLEFRA